MSTHFFRVQGKKKNRIGWEQASAMPDKIHFSQYHFKQKVGNRKRSDWQKQSAMMPTES
ncbi:MAG: hypothetical protein HOE30_02190 [Deltaproteobacteria bacterium]|jgi:hypothetical protein|nr:hypothetical protein [Deltaproteobacteria bacterium]